MLLKVNTSRHVHKVFRLFKHKIFNDSVLLPKKCFYKRTTKLHDHSLLLVDICNKKPCTQEQLLHLHVVDLWLTTFHRVLYCHLKIRENVVNHDR